MGIPLSLLVIGFGAFLAFAVTGSTSGFDVQAAGLIIMAVGFIGLLLSFVMWDSWMGAGYFSRPPDERTLRQDQRR